MSSSHMDSPLPLTCSICGEYSQSFVSLHQHHMSCHTAEELSLAIIAFKESEKKMAGIENEHLLFTQLCKVQRQCDLAAVFSHSIAATADHEDEFGENKQTEQTNEKEDTEDSNERNLEMCYKSNIEANKLNYIHKRNACLCNEKLEELDVSGCYNTEKENMLPLNLNETNKDDDMKSEIIADTEMVYIDKSSNTHKKHRKVKKATDVTEITMCNTHILQSEVSHCLDSERVILDMECVDDLDRSLTEKILEDSFSSSVTENSSTDSKFHAYALDKFSQSDICIQAIITRLSNIVEAASESLEDNDSKSKQDVPKKYKRDYILPSPLRKYHHSKVSYDFGLLDDNERHTEGNIDDFFRPSIKMNGFKDAICETIPTDFSEKEVQVDSDISLIDLQDSNVQTALKEQHEKYTQTGIISLTIRRLAAYRKPFKSSPLTDNNSRPPNKDCVSLSKLLVIPPEKTAQIYPGMTNDRRFFCELCGKGYKKKSHLERHVRVHTGERPFPCPYCDKRFAVRSILKQHVRTHTGEKPYCCSLCLQRFPQKSGLMTHTMLHTGKPFKCDKCEKAFVSNHKLLQHLSSHGNKSCCKYTCSVCKTEFLTKGAMLQHRHIHGSKPLFLSHNFSNTLISK